jgi:hypothetical protein
LDKENLEVDIHPRLHIRYKLADGRCNCLIVWPDGEWKVEVFASEQHVRHFAAMYTGMEVVLDDQGN